jgi:hypothetical protein
MHSWNTNCSSHDERSIVRRLLAPDLRRRTRSLREGHLPVDSYCTMRVKWNCADPAAEQLERPRTFAELLALLIYLSMCATATPMNTLTSWPRMQRRKDGRAAKQRSVGWLRSRDHQPVGQRSGGCSWAPERDAWFLFRHEPRPRFATRTVHLSAAHGSFTWTAATIPS